MPLTIQPPSYSLEDAHPERVAPVGRSTTRLSAPVSSSAQVEEPAAAPLPPSRFTSPRVTPEQAWADIEGPLGLKTLSGYRGYGKMASGFRKLVPTSIEPPPTRKQAEVGATELLRGAMTAATPLAAAATVAQPEIALLAGAGGVVGGYTAKKIADAVQASPETRDLVEQAGQILGGMAGGVAYAGLHAAASPEDALTDVLWKRGYVRDAKGEPISFGSQDEARYAAQQMIRQNPGGIVTSFLRKAGLSRAAAELPEVSLAESARRAAGTAQWNYNQQQATNYADDVVGNQSRQMPPALPPRPDPAATIIAERDIVMQRAVRVAQGKPPLTPEETPPPAPPPPQVPEIDSDRIQQVGAMLAKLPPDVRAKAIIETHGTLSKLILQQGKIVVDGKLEVVKTPEQADSVAQRLINDQIKAHDEAAAKAAEPAKETKPAAAAQPSTQGVRANSRQKAAELAKPQYEIAEAPAPKFEIVEPEEKVESGNGNQAKSATPDVPAEAGKQTGGSAGSDVLNTQRENGGAAGGQPVTGAVSSPQERPVEVPPAASAEKAPLQKGDPVTFTRNLQVRKGEGKSEVIPAGTRAFIEHANAGMNFARVRLTDGRVQSVPLRNLEAGHEERGTAGGRVSSEAPSRVGAVGGGPGAAEGTPVAPEQRTPVAAGGKAVPGTPTEVQPSGERAVAIPHGHWMNEGDIEQALEKHASHPVLSKATKFLKEFMDEVNSHSDGWPYWRAPAHAAEQLEGLIQHPELATEQALTKAMSPIKSFMAKRGIAAGMKMPEIALETAKPEAKAAPPAENKLAAPAETESKIETEKPHEPQAHQTARAAGNPQEVPSVSSPASQGGAARTPVPSEGSRATEAGGNARGSAGQPHGTSVERPEGREGQGNEPARSGRTGAAEHPPAQRTRGGTSPTGSRGADGRAIESPVPEHPEEARTTAAELRNQRNYHISDEEAAAIGSGGEKAKLNSNLDALELLKKIQEEGREVATPDEQKILAKYVDFGGLVGMLERPYDYPQQYARYQKILTPAEQQEIKETLPNTHYTSMEMVDATWKALQRLGFKRGRWIEPGMGIGNFVGRVPEKIAEHSEIYGVERNPLTGSMAKLLYPDAKIQVKPFQQFQIPNNSFDAAIGNVPFQDVNITDDPAYKDLKLNLHNYFIVKTLDKLKPGGVAALITSRYTMDSAKGSGERAREEMAKRADLVAAIRLPDSAFKGNARTEVVADLLIFQKRDPNVPLKEMPEWTKTVPLKVGNETYQINQYIADNPGQVLGEHSDQGKMYAKGTYTVKAPKDFTEALSKAVESLPRNIFGKTKVAESEMPPSTLEPQGIEFAPEDVKPGAFFRDEKGKIKIKESGVAKDLPEAMRSKAAQEHLGAAIDLRDQVNRTIALQLETSDDEPLKVEQAKLDKLYTAYQKQYGPLHSPLLAKIFKNDPEYGKLLALENVDTESKEITKAAIFSKRVLAPYEPLRDLPDEPKSAMLKVMAERGYLDTALMAELLNKPEADVVKNLEKEGLIYQDPQTGAHSPADEYLSGNVREKLKLAEQARESDPKFERNVEALKQVQPKPLTIHDIQPNLGQPWIPMNVYKGFLAHLAKQRHIDIDISRDTTGRWLVSIEGNKFNLDHQWAGGGIGGHKLVQYALNQQQPSVYDTVDDKRVFNAEKTTAAREKLAMIKEEFASVLRRANQQIIDNLEQIYNDTFNGYKLREFSGEHLDFPGMSEDWRKMIRGYQKAAIWRILQEGRGGIFHAPGLGKTLTMAAAGMEARRLKLSRKNMYAVPNHIIPQWREDFKRFYPNANVLAVTDDDFNPTNRAQLMSRIATGDWDAVIVPHSQFDLLPMSPAWEKISIDRRLADYREVLNELDGDNDKRTIKQIEKAIDKLEARLNELNSKKKDNTIHFDEMGIDMLFVDEAHLYKSMAVPTKMGNIGGISNSASKRAFALEMKANYLRDTHKGRGLVFGTGTPITNTVGELYVMTKYLAPEMLEAAGIRSFDDWAANFAQTVTQWEYAPDGVTFKPKTTLSEFVNVPELSTMFRRYAEYLSKEAARALSNLKEPRVKRVDHTVTITPSQEPLLDMIAQRGEHLIKNPPRTKEERQADNWLKLSGDARKISLDARLYDPDLNDDANSKANDAARTIKDILDRSKAEKGAVVVFSDFFQHKNSAGVPDFNLFDDIKEKLVKAGVPAKEIALIHDIKPGEKEKEEKELLFARVRSGKVRVIFGSTEKLGIGTNIQARLKGELHLDQPWRPDQVEQREGRIERSGNMWDDVEIHRFIAEPREGTVKKFDPDAEVPLARILEKGEKPHDYEKTVEAGEDKQLAYNPSHIDEADVKKAIADGKMQALLDQKVRGGIVEAPRPRAYDLQMYQQLARKANFQEQFLTGNYTGRTMEDVGGDVKLNSQMFALGKAMATGNPDALRKMKVEHDLRTYSMLERNFQVERSKAQREESRAEFRIPVLEKQVAKLDKDIATWREATKGEEEKDYPGLKVVVGGKAYQGKEGPTSLKEWLDSDPPIEALVDLPISIGGLPTTVLQRAMKYSKDSKSFLYEYTLAGDRHDIPFDEKEDTTHVRSLINSFAMRARGLEARRATTEYDIRYTKEQLANLREELKRTSPYTVKVDGMEKELAEINKRLGIKGPAEVDEGAPEEEGAETEGAAGNKENLITGERGELAPGAPLAAVAQAAGRVGDFLREEVADNRRAHELQWNLYDLDKRHEGRVLHAKQLLEGLQKDGVTQEDRRAIDEHLDALQADSEEVPIPTLTPAQDKILDDVLSPMREQAEAAYRKVNAGGMTIPNYNPRQVKGRGGMLDRFLTPEAEKRTGRGNVLSQTNPATKHRSMMAIEAADGAGERRVVSIKANEVTAMEGGEEGRQIKMGKLSSGLTTNLGILNQQLDPLVERMGELRKQIAAVPDEDKKSRVEAINDKIQELQKERNAQKNAAGREIGKTVGERSVFGTREAREFADKIAALEQERADIQTSGHMSNAGEARVRRLKQNLSEVEAERDRVLEQVPTAELLDKIWIDKNGKRWRIGQATKNEIEAQSKVRYYHDAAASTIVNWLQAKKAEAAFDFMENLKSDPDFSKIAMKSGGENPPKGWRITNLPQMKGYYFEPHTAEVLDWFNDRLKSGNPNAFDSINSYMRMKILLNPIKHPLNVGAQWAIEKGATGFLPHRWMKIERSGAKAINAVLNQNEDFLTALDAGAPLQSAHGATHDLVKLFYDELAKGAEQGQPWATKLAKAVGFAPVELVKILHGVSSKVAWVTSDIMFLQAAYEYQMDHAGVSLHDALREVGRIIPEYRLPTRIFDSPTVAKVMSSNWGTIFGAYHYGLLRSFSESAKAALGAGEPAEGKTRAEEVGKGWSRLALMAIGAFAIYAAADELARKLTGNKDAQASRHGIFGLIQAAYDVARKEETATQAMMRVMTPNPATFGIGQVLFNRDLRTGRHIYDPAADWATDGTQLMQYLKEQTLPQGQQLERAAHTDEGWKKFLWNQADVNFPKHGAEKLAQEIASSKMDTSAWSPEDRERYDARQRALDGLRRGDSKALEEGLEKGQIRSDELTSILRRSQGSPLYDRVHGFSYEETLRVFQKAVDDKDEAAQEELLPLLLEKQEKP